MQYLNTVARVGSIRKAAEQLSITSSALNRRIIAMEEDLGVPVFDRVPNGVRLNAAGELLVQHFRSQMADMERVKSQIKDLQGERRGHVSIACSQAPMVSLLPAQIEKYRALHPAVTFSIRVCTRYTAVTDLKSFDADIAVVFEPDANSDFQSVCSVPQQLHAQFSASHPLARKETVRLRDCFAWPLALPTRSNGVRHLLEMAAARSSVAMNVVIESDNFYFLRRVLANDELVSFTMPSGLPSQSSTESVLGSPLNIPTDSPNDLQASLQTSQPGSDLVHRQVDARDIPTGVLQFGQLKGRHLPVAAAKFLEQLSNTVLPE